MKLHRLKTQIKSVSTPRTLRDLEVVGDGREVRVLLKDRVVVSGHARELHREEAGVQPAPATHFSFFFFPATQMY